MLIRLPYLAVPLVVGWIVVSGCASFMPTRSREARAPEICPLLNTQGLPTVVSFRDYAAWNNSSYETSIKGSTSARAAAEFRVLETGIGQIRLEVKATSNNFKFFSRPLAVVMVADSKGEILETVDATALAMSMGGGFSDNFTRTGGNMEPDEACQAAYIFFRLRFCSYRQGFDRLNKESSPGCTRLPGGQLYTFLDQEKEELTKQLPIRVGSLGVSVGQSFELLGWQSVRLR